VQQHVAIIFTPASTSVCQWAHQLTRQPTDCTHGYLDLLTVFSRSSFFLVLVIVISFFYVFLISGFYLSDKGPSVSDFFNVLHNNNQEYCQRSGQTRDVPYSNVRLFKHLLDTLVLSQSNHGR